MNQATHEGDPVMELVTKKRLLLFAGRGHPALSEEIAHNLKVPLSSVTLSRFANGEIYCRYDESIRGADVFVLQTHCEPINDRIFEQLIMIDAAKRASAKRITAVCPFYGYARQDRKAEGREPITARLLADMLTVAGADRVVTVDLHTGQIQGFFDFPVDHLTAVPLLAEYVSRSIAGEEVTVVAPDAGGGKLARRFANCLGEHGIDAELAFVDKHRPKGTHNVAVAQEVVGAVEGRTCVLIDDMIDTGGTLTSAAELLVGRGADSVIIAATHGLLSGPAVDRLKNAPGARGRGHQHAPDPRRQALRQPHGALDRPDRGRGARRRLRRHQRQRDLPRRQFVRRSGRPLTWRSGGPATRMVSPPKKVKRTPTCDLLVFKATAMGKIAGSKEHDEDNFRNTEFDFFTTNINLHSQVVKCDGMAGSLHGSCNCPA